MLYALVDIGSNTVRLNIYDIINEKSRFLLSKKYALGLVSYVIKGKLNKKGLDKLLNVIEDIKIDLEDLNVEKFNMFATASIRNINNQKHVLDTIHDKLGIKIHVLSENQEAMYSFSGSTSIMKNKSGVLIDVGGGSSEVVIYKNLKIKQEYSLSIGSLTMFNDYVSLLIPTEEESHAIQDRVQYEISRAKIPKEKIKYMCGVGGSVRAVYKLMKDLRLINRKEFIFDPVVFKLIREEIRNNDKETYNRLLEVKPARIHTIMPGLLIIQELCDYFGIEEMQVSKFGVREGYLNNKLSKGI